MSTVELLLLAFAVPGLVVMGTATAVLVRPQRALPPEWGLPRPLTREMPEMARASAGDGAC